jgi:hypothetical protein
MFEWLRRGRSEEGSPATLPVASTVRHGPRDDLARVGWRLLGTSPADKALLASLLASPPAWSNNLAAADLEGSPAEAAPVEGAAAFGVPAPMSAGLRASLAGQVMFGPQLIKGGLTWDHPARG